MSEAAAPPPPAPEGGAHLLRRIADGDRTALAELVEQHQGAVFRFARTLLADDASAEDVMQETFMAALKGAHGFRADGSARGWLLTIARRLALRQRGRETSTDDDALEQLGRAAGWGVADDPEQSLSLEEQRAVVTRALSRLSGEDREILALRDMEGLSGPETAEVLGLGLAAMKSRLHRARLRFAAALRPEVSHDG